MKLKNCVIGQQVEVKDQDDTGFYSWFRGKKGEIVKIDHADGMTLTVHVKFDNGQYDWGNHNGIKKVKGV